MTILSLSDVHGNWPALAEVLRTGGHPPLDQSL
jgi:hypothetical protein